MAKGLDQARSCLQRLRRDIKEGSAHLGLLVYLSFPHQQRELGTETDHLAAAMADSNRDSISWLEQMRDFFHIKAV